MATVEMKDVVLTDEDRKKLKLFRPIKCVNRFPYVPKVYRELFPDKKHLWPVFTLSAAGGIDKVLGQDALFPEISGNETIRVNRGAMTKAICAQHIHEWHTYWDIDSGEEFAFDKTLQCVGPELLHELANVILSPEENGLSDEEKLGLR